MSKINRWLLPEGVEEILPNLAWSIHNYQQSVLELFSGWGYDLVIPPLLEYTDSLLLDHSSDIDLQTFKLVDQLSGRSMGIRADITPQTCRIDAHSLKQDGVTRLCYAGSVLHSVPKSQLASRTPIEVGAELFGDDSINSDFESISLMIASLELANVPSSEIHLDLGHVGIYRGLLNQAQLSAEQEQDLLDAFDRKAGVEVAAILAEANITAELAAMIQALVSLNGGAEILDKALEVLASAPHEVLSAVHMLKDIASAVSLHSPETPLFFDLAELRGFAYHTGLVFAAYIDGVGHSVANGGRFDNLGQAFGRGRPATGFNINVKALMSLSKSEDSASVILAPAISSLSDPSLKEFIRQLRAQGERVVFSLDADQAINAQRHIVSDSGQWLIKPIS